MMICAKVRRMKRFYIVAFAAAMLFSLSAGARGQSVLVEAESFDKLGGWSLDTQSIEGMGSPYLLAHGIGKFHMMKIEYFIFP